MSGRRLVAVALGVKVERGLHTAVAKQALDPLRGRPCPPLTSQVESECRRLCRPKAALGTLGNAPRHFFRLYQIQRVDFSWPPSCRVQSQDEIVPVRFSVTILRDAAHGVCGIARRITSHIPGARLIQGWSERSPCPTESVFVLLKYLPELVWKEPFVGVPRRTE